MATKVIEGQKPRRSASREKPPSSPDPIEIAMVAAASGKPLPDAALNVLEKHAKLIDRQADLAQAQCAELKLRRVGEGVRAALWAILAIAALAVVGLVAAVLVRASRSDALIVQSFRVPPSLAAKGLTGEVVATQVLDRLADMQVRTESARAASSYANNWEDELKIDIPNTGATTDQVWKLLRGWLGKETRITGEVIDAGKGGLVLTARVGADPGQRFVSADGDLDSLIGRGAELIFQRTQPYRHAVYVGRDPERSTDRLAALRRLTRDPSAMERKWAYNGLAYFYRLNGDYRGSINMAQQALAIDPNMLPSLQNMATAQTLLGHDQAAVDTNLRESKTPVGEGYDLQINAANRCGQLGEMGVVTREPIQLDEAAKCLEGSPESYAQFAATTRLDAAWLRRDAAPLRAFRQTVSEATTQPDAAAITALYRLRGEMMLGASPALAEALRTYVDAAVAQAGSPPAAAYYQAALPTNAWPVQAQAMLMLERNAEAAALISKTPRDCYTCVRVRGMVAQANGNAADAQRWFRLAIRQGPRLAPAYVDHGRLLAAKRRWAGAERHFAKAAELAPSWGDPLKFWGDALASQGRRAEALDKYDAALQLSPRWAELRRIRARLASN
jgi:tetratricopeptide (TPR) repeat protein